jgi:hypothetical protein
VWRERAAVRREEGAESTARLYDLVARELEHALNDTASELLTLEAAALESGHSTRQLRHLIATGQLENSGRKHAPRIKRADLPKRATKASDGRGRGFDPDAFALSLHNGGKRPA